MQQHYTGKYFVYLSTNQNKILIMSQERVISIQHVSGVYKIKFREEEFVRVHSGIMKCIKKELDCFGKKDDNGNETFYPAELLRNSVITFEPTEIDLQLAEQRI